MEFAVFTAPVCYVYNAPSETRTDEKGRVLSTIADEALYGSVCRVLERCGDGWVYQLSAYGYGGYVREENLRTIASPEEYFARPLAAVRGHFVDILSEPTVHGVPMVYLPENALVERVQDGFDGWTRVRLVNGDEGYIPTSRLKEKRFGEDFLYTDADETMAYFRAAQPCRLTAQGGRKDFSLQKVLDRFFDGNEEHFRRFLTQDALSYLGTQYRWGGRCSFGIDCSGLTYTCYSDAGILIYRDAVLVDGYTLRRLPIPFPNGKFDAASIGSVDLRPGDTLYFPGHTALYLGDGKYIHSTAHAGSDGVVINSLLPSDEDFRQDLLDSLYAFGGVR